MQTWRDVADLTTLDDHITAMLAAPMDSARRLAILESARQHHLGGIRLICSRHPGGVMTFSELRRHARRYHHTGDVTPAPPDPREIGRSGGNSADFDLDDVPAAPTSPPQAGAALISGAAGHTPGATVMRICAAAGCDRHVLPGQLMCRPHWTRVPAQLQTKVTKSWRAYSAAASTADVTLARTARRAYERARAAAVEQVTP